MLKTNMCIQLMKRQPEELARPNCPPRRRVHACVWRAVRQTEQSAKSVRQKP